MPSGFEFVCENKDCKYYKTGFVITRPWPLGDINLVIESDKVSKIEGFKEELIKLRDQGKEYACINYPNTNNIPEIGYRIQKWCNKCSCIWTCEIVKEKEDETVAEGVERMGDITECSTCKGELMDFEVIKEDGIPCPFCKVKMKEKSWFINEK